MPISAGNQEPRPEAFALDKHRYVYLIGGGGKTYLMFALARALGRAGRSVLTTTTTRIWRPKPADSDHVQVAPYSSALIDRLKTEFSHHRRITAVPAAVDEGRKLSGFTPDELDALMRARVADYMLVEADGAAGRSLKAHQDHEPVLSVNADLVIAVIGVDCIGMPMDDRHVHRAALFCERLGRIPGSVITVEDVAAIVFHDEGYLRRVGPGSEVMVYVSKVGTPEAEATANRLAETLQRADAANRLRRVVVGDLR